MIKFIQDDQPRKLDLISEIIKIRIEDTPEHDINWFGDVFDELYEKDIEVLKIILKLKPK